jgi:hypothetical protein
VATTIEQVLIQGDLSRLTPEQKLAYYLKVCDSLKLNPYTKPFAYLKLQGGEKLYANRDATDQLRKIHGVSIVSLEREQLGDLYVVTATAKAADGRMDTAIGAVPTQGLKGEALANALMKCETKSKRRVTLSICGLGMTDDSEVDSIPGAQRVAIELDQDLGDVQLEEEDERDAAIRSWVDASEEATRLGITHKELPHNASLDGIRRWTDALTAKILEAEKEAAF